MDAHAEVRRLGQRVFARRDAFAPERLQRHHVVRQADVRRHPGQVQRVEHIDGGQRAVQPVFAALQVAVVGLGHAALQHQRLVQKQRAGEHGQADQQPGVPLMGHGQRQQQ